MIVWLIYVGCLLASITDEDHDFTDLCCSPVVMVVVVWGRQVQCQEEALATHQAGHLNYYRGSSLGCRTKYRVTSFCSCRGERGW